MRYGQGDSGSLQDARGCCLSLAYSDSDSARVGGYVLSVMSSDRSTEVPNIFNLLLLKQPCSFPCALANVSYAAIAGDRCHKLNSQSGQHCSHWVTETEAAGMTGVEGTADIVTVGAEVTPFRPV